MATKKEQIAQEIAKAVGAGKSAIMETVDFSDPNRPKTCLEVDFPILSVNQVAIIEGNAGKPIYQMSKWWARRRSSVFRSMLIAAATKSPDDKSYAAKIVWDNYYANFQKKGSFKKIKVADIFMGGGTTLVEGSRLGMEMIGNDLNPIAWFVTKQELSDVDLNEVKRLLQEVEQEVKPQIMPYYYCDGPNGQKGVWVYLPENKEMGADFDPLKLTVEERKKYTYKGPEVIYSFWAKHGPCQVTGCGHRTPVLTSPVMAIKTLSVKYWEHTCSNCQSTFDVEEKKVRMAPDVSLYVAPTEASYTTIDPKLGVVCPKCNHSSIVNLGKGKTKKVEMSLLVHPQWMGGSSSIGQNGKNFGGSAQDDASDSAAWDLERANQIRLLEVRGALPSSVTCPDTNVTFKTGKDGGTVPKNSNYICGKCGTVQDILTTVKATGKTAPMAGYAVQAYSPFEASRGDSYGGRFFAPFNNRFALQYDAAQAEWDARKNTDLAEYWPRSELPYAFMTHHLQGGVPNHGFTHWWTMFNPRQLLVHAQLLKSIATTGNFSWETREYVLGAFQNFLRNESMFSFWHIKADKLAPAMSNSNFHPKSNVVEVGVFPPMGYGPWSSTTAVLTKGREWAMDPWEVVSVEGLCRSHPNLGELSSGKSEKVLIGDSLLPVKVSQGSSTELVDVLDASIDLVITDPPFGGLLHYSELSDYFYVWLRLVLKSRYPDIFGPEFTPKAMEVVANKAREPEDADGFYQRLLTQCWQESHRILKAGGILAFTFHHSEDEPWVAVLESLFNAGFYLEATYPIRSDETKGEGEFGSRTIEYDIIHVCRKRTEEPKPVSWGRMRREVMADVRQLQSMLENHAKEGLPEADIQVIRRGKALEYFSRHYGKVFIDEGRPISVKDALIGINQLIDEDADKGKDTPPINSEPMTRQFLRVFQGSIELARDQLQKFLKGSITTPDEFVHRGWCFEKNKIFTIVDPLVFAQDWQGKHKRKLTSDLDQALVLIGACFDGSGINAADTLKNENFKPHVALKALLEWFGVSGPSPKIRNAALRAISIYNNWAASNKQEAQQMALFLEE